MVASLRGVAVDGRYESQGISGRLQKKTRGLSLRDEAVEDTLTCISAYGCRGKAESSTASSFAASTGTSGREPPSLSASRWEVDGIPVMGSRWDLKWATVQDGLILRSENEVSERTCMGTSEAACIAAMM